MTFSKIWALESKQKILFGILLIATYMHLIVMAISIGVHKIILKSGMKFI